MILPVGDLLVFPNPNAGVFAWCLIALGLHDEQVNYEVWDVTGRMVVRGDVKTGNGEARATVDMKDVSPGNYILKVKTSAGVVAAPFVVGGQ